MNPKFSVGEWVYLDDPNSLEGIIYRVDSPILHIYEYTIVWANGISLGGYVEWEILKKSYWEAKYTKPLTLSSQQNNQNNIGRAAFDRGIEFKIKNNTACVCGAHAIKDARHSHWCDIKN